MLAADCKKRSVTPARMGGHDAAINGLLCFMNRTTMMRKMIGEEHQKLSSRLISSAGGGAGLLHKIPKPTAWGGVLQVLKELEEGAKPHEQR